MSTRTNLRPQVVLAGDMSGDLTSAVTIFQSLSGVSYGIKWAGTAPLGVLSVEVSDDYSLNPDGRTVDNAGTWNAMPFSDSTGTMVTSVAISGATGNGFIDIGKSMGYAIRVVYVATSGTGTLTVVVNGKVS